VPAVRVTLPLPAGAASSVVHDHFWLQRLVYYVGVAARTTAASYVHVSTALLAIARLLERASRATRHHISLVWIRHVIVLLLAECLAAVRRHRSSRRAVDHAAAVARRVRQGVVSCTLIVHRLVLRSSEAAVDALANDLVERAAHLLL
jgi:hypothetical protein